MSENRAMPRSYAEWDQLVDEWLSSGEKQAKFAEAHGINTRTFQGRVYQSRKRRGLTKKRRALPCKFVEVTAATAEETGNRDSGACRITMSNTTVEFTSSSDSGFVAEVLSRLGQIGR